MLPDLKNLKIGYNFTYGLSCRFSSAKLDKHFTRLNQFIINLGIQPPGVVVAAEPRPPGGGLPRTGPPQATAPYPGLKSLFQPSAQLKHRAKGGPGGVHL